nr:hypothetical protein [uncultured Neisseria sp.]
MKKAGFFTSLSNPSPYDTSPIFKIKPYAGFVPMPRMNVTQRITPAQTHL